MLLFIFNKYIYNFKVYLKDCRFQNLYKRLKKFTKNKNKKQKEK